VAAYLAQNGREPTARQIRGEVVFARALIADLLLPDHPVIAKPDGDEEPIFEHKLKVRAGLVKEDGVTIPIGRDL